MNRFQNGTYPKPVGLYIEELSIAEIEKLVLATMEMKDDEIIHQTQQTQAEALWRFSRSAFQNQMERFIISALAQFKT